MNRIWEQQDRTVATCDETEEVMPYRLLVNKHLAELLGVLSHPQRLRIIEELYQGEKDVRTLADILQISSSGVSQHLSLLKVRTLIEERKQGRNVYYHLRSPELAVWLLEGLKFAGPHQADAQEFESAMKQAMAVWSVNQNESLHPSERE